MQTVIHSFFKNLLPCLTKLSSEKTRGGRNIVPKPNLSTLPAACKGSGIGGHLLGRRIALLPLLLLWGGTARAQCADGTNKINCGDLSVEIEAFDNSSISSPECNLHLPNCRRVQYEVYLAIDNTGLAGKTFCLDYERLTVVTRLSVSGAAFGIPLSRINPVESFHCVEGFDWECFMSYPEGRAQLEIAPGVTGCPPALPTIEFAADGSGHARVHLYTVVADAWPGETVTLSCDQVFYATVGDIVFDPGLDDWYTCDLHATEDDPNTIGCTANASAEVDFGGVPNDDYTILLGGELDEGAYREFVVEIKVTSDTDPSPYLDFTILVEADQPFMAPEIWEDDTDAHDVEVERWEIANGGTTIYLFYVRLVSEAALSSIAPAELCRLRLYPPVFISCGGTASIEFGKGRIQPTATACETLAHDNGALGSDFGECPDECADDFSVTVTGVAPANCFEQVQAKIVFDWDGMEDEREFDFVELELDFLGDLEILGASLSGAMTCNTDNPQNCDNSDCQITLNGDATLLICFKQGTLGPTTITRGMPVTISFASVSGCVDDVVIRRAKFRPAGGGPDDFCIPAEGNRVVGNFPVCYPFVAGEIINSASQPVVGVDVNIVNSTTCEENLVSGCAGYALCTCDYDTYKITPNKNDDHLNGVTTFDLVFIRRHILGIAPFTSLEDRIAADAIQDNEILDDGNNSDIEAIRKVILGINPTFDSNNDDSWRFYHQPVTLSLNDPDDLSEVSAIEEFLNVDVSAMGNTPSNINFRAIKIGDLNGTHHAGHCRPADASRRAAEAANAGPLSVGLPLSAARAGEFVTVPFQHLGKTSLHAAQACFRFDADMLEYVGISSGEVEGVAANCFGFTEVAHGLIRLSWLSPDMNRMAWRPGQTLCHLTFRARQPLTADAPALSLDESVLAAQGYTNHELVFDLRLEADTRDAANRSLAPDSSPFGARCLPNPTAGDVTLRVEMPTPAPKTRVAVFGPFGQRLAYRQLDLPEGGSDIALPEVAQLAPGVYVWRVWNKAGRQEGRLIKQ